MRRLHWPGTRARYTVALAAALVGIAACGESQSSTSSASNASSGSAGVNLGTAAAHVNATDQLQFSPNTTMAKVGDIVQWTNTGSVQHTITFDSASSLTDPSLVPGASWEVKFSSRGTFTYHCSIHAGMTGTVTVQ